MSQVQITNFLDNPDLTLIPKIADVEAASTEWVVEDLIAQGEYHLISGAPASMKSMLALSMGYGISTGADVFGRKTVQKTVLYIDKENPVSLIKDRQVLLELIDESNLHYWGSWVSEIPTCFDPVYPKLAEKYQPVMIFDSLIRLNTLDENKATEMRQVSESFRRLCNLGATVIVLHHRGKPSVEGSRSPFRGSSEIEAGCDIAYCLTKKMTEDGVFLDVRCFKNRHGPESQFGLKFDPEKGLFLPLPTEEEVQQECIQRISEIIADNPNAGIAQIRLKTQLPDKKLRGLLKRGEGTFWKSEAGPHNKRQYLSMDNG